MCSHPASPTRKQRPEWAKKVLFDPFPFGFIQQNGQNLEKKKKMAIKQKGLSWAETGERHWNGERAVPALCNFLATLYCFHHVFAQLSPGFGTIHDMNFPGKNTFFGNKMDDADGNREMSF